MNPPIDDDVDGDDDDDDDDGVLQLQLLVLYHEMIRTNVLSNYGVTTYQNYWFPATCCRVS